MGTCPHRRSNLLRRHGLQNCAELKKGWTKIDFDDCILSDLTEGDNNQFSYLLINEIDDLWDRLKV